MIKHITLFWFAASITSLTVYAFTGHGPWVQLEPNDGFMRFMLLTLFHMGGTAAYPTYKSIEGSEP